LVIDKPFIFLLLLVSRQKIFKYCLTEYMRRIKIIILVVVSLITSFLTISSIPVHASVLDDMVNGVKNIFSPEQKELKIDSNITLSPDGDINKNGEIDAGDIVRFTYTIINKTDKAYSYSTVKTGIDRKQLNFIHNVEGATGILDDDKTLIFPNVRINPNEQQIISFDARLNYAQENKTITTEPEFIGSDKNSIIKSVKKEIVSKKLGAEEIRKRIEKGGMILNVKNK